MGAGLDDRILVSRKDDDIHRRRTGSQFGDDADSVAVAQPNVEQDDFRPKSFDRFPQRVQTVELAANIKTRRFQQCAGPRADYGMVVDDQYTRLHI